MTEGDAMHKLAWMLVFSAGNVLGVEQDARWWLSIGAGIGEVEVVGHERAATVAAVLQGAGYQVNNIMGAAENDDTDTWLVSLGYRASPNWGWAARFHDMGRTEGNFSADLEDFTTPVFGSIESTYRAYSVSALGYWPVWHWLELSAELGVHHWQHEFSLQSSVGVDEDSSDSGNNVLFGFGAGLRATSWFSFDLAWQRYYGIEDEAGVDVKSITAVLSF